MEPRGYLVGDQAIPGELPFRAVFLNYLLDCLPAADLKIRDGEVFQLCVRTCLARNLPLGEYTRLTREDLARKGRSQSAADHRDLLQLYGLFASEYEYRAIPKEDDVFAVGQGGRITNPSYGMGAASVEVGRIGNPSNT